MNTDEKVMNYMKTFLEEDYGNLKEDLRQLIKKYEKKSKRFDKIMKQSDKQQMEVLKLNEEIAKLREYDIEQQNAAKRKLEAGIVLEFSEGLEIETIFIPSDILSGDYYSSYKKDDGSTLFFILDGQGHGIPPSLTVFGVASIIHRYVKESKSLEDLGGKVIPYIQQFLGESEQLSYTVIEISKDLKTLDYCVGGMYPPLIKQKGVIKELGSTGLPIMNFLSEVNIVRLELDGFERLILFSDGILEGQDSTLKDYAPQRLIEDQKLFNKAKKNLPNLERDDDITVLMVSKN